MRELATPLCVLEPQVASHAEKIFHVLSDPAMYEFENAPPESEVWLHERFRKLEARQSPDGSQRWLNWVVRLHDGQLAGYVQATVFADGHALIAYELASRHWRRGIGTSSVNAMMEELALHYGVGRYVAVLKARNARSLGLLASMGFAAATSDEAARHGPEPDEIVMTKQALSRTTPDHMSARGPACSA